MAIFHTSSPAPSSAQGSEQPIFTASEFNYRIRKIEEDYKSKLYQEYLHGVADGKKQAAEEAAKSKPQPSGKKVFTRSFSGSSIVIQDGKMIVNGKVVTSDDNGNDLGFVDSIEINGNVGSVRTMSGSVTVQGNIQGDARTMSGMICKNN